MAHSSTVIMGSPSTLQWGQWRSLSLLRYRPWLEGAHVGRLAHTYELSLPKAPLLGLDCGGSVLVGTGDECVHFVLCRTTSGLACCSPSAVASSDHNELHVKERTMNCTFPGSPVGLGGIVAMILPSALVGPMSTLDPTHNCVLYGLRRTSTAEAPGAFPNLISLASAQPGFEWLVDGVL